MYININLLSNFPRLSPSLYAAIHSTTPPNRFLGNVLPKREREKKNKQKKSYILKIGTLNASDVRQPTKPAGGASQTCSETETTYINLRKDSQSSIRALLTRKHKSSTITRSILILNAKFRRSKVIKKKK